MPALAAGDHVLAAHQAHRADVAERRRPRSPSTVDPCAWEHVADDRDGRRSMPRRPRMRLHVGDVAVELRDDDRPRVRRDAPRGRPSADIRNVSKSWSTKTGTSCWKSSGMTEPGSVNDETITSVPGSRSSAPSRRVDRRGPGRDAGHPVDAEILGQLALVDVDLGAVVAVERAALGHPVAERAVVTASSSRSSTWMRGGIGVGPDRRAAVDGETWRGRRGRGRHRRRMLQRSPVRTVARRLCFRRYPARVRRAR